MTALFCHYEGRAMAGERNAPNARLVETVRPLTIGAPRTAAFECLSPDHMSAKEVTLQLFELYEMEACGWNWKTTRIERLGGGVGYRRWRVRK